jgi:tetratricopeptide (TPR) repeat protein
VLDDLHWADEASLRLLGFLARALDDACLLVVATYRDVELRRGHPLNELLGALAREPACERIPLRGFAAEDTERLIAAIGGAVPSSALAAAVHDMTDGNPFFIQEVVRLLSGSGGVADVADAPRPLALPQSVRDAVGRRLDALSAECNALLRVAAVLGREFDVPLLGRVAELAEVEVLERLAEAVRAHVLDEGDGVPGRYRFHHSLIRQTLYDELSTPERVRLHAQAGAALETLRGADVEPVLDELAHHFFQAAPLGESARAIDYCLRAARRAHRLLAYEQSARQYERALQLFELHGPPDAARRGELVAAVGEAHALAGARERARAAFSRAAEIGRAVQRPDILARAALGYRGQGEMGTPVEEAARALLDEALAAVADAWPALRARLLSRLAGTPPHSDSLAARESMSREALELARATPDGAALRDALEARLWACLGPDHLDDRLAVASELLQLAQTQHNPHMAMLAYEARLGTHLIRGDIAAADQALAAVTQVAEALREPAMLFFATFYQGSRALAGGELDRAEQLFRAALARGRGTVPYAHFMCTAQLYVLHYLRGTDDDDPELHRVFFGEMLALPYSWEPAMRSALALSFYLRGERDEARRSFEAVAGRGFENIRRDEHWLVTVGSLSTVAVLLADRERAAQLYELMRPYADLVFVHDLLRSVGGTVASALGSLATLLGRYDEGERHYERAHAQETAMGGVTAFIDRAGYARLLLLRDRPGDRARATALLAQVRQAMARVGIRRNWQLTAIEDLGLLAKTAHSRSARGAG